MTTDLALKYRNGLPSIANGTFSLSSGSSSSESANGSGESASASGTNSSASSDYSLSACMLESASQSLKSSSSGTNSLKTSSAALNNLISNIASFEPVSLDFSNISFNTGNNIKNKLGKMFSFSKAQGGSSIGQNAVKFAMQFKGKNGSQMSGPMSKSGFHKGLWCGDFAHFALKNAFSAAGKKLPAGYEAVSASCSAVASWARKNGRAYKDPSKAQPGDILVMNSEGHIGIVVSVDKKGIHTIEGNTSGPNGRYCNGGYVNERVRNFNCVSTFVRMS